jgi:hypothetical protein
MNNEKIQFHMDENFKKAEIVIREVNSVNELPIRPPLKIAIVGTIGAVSEFLARRLSELDQINPKRCYVLVDRQKMSISLTTNENDEYNTNSVCGKLETHPKFIEFGINQGKQYEPGELGQFLKMNRVFFQDRNENFQLVSNLVNFTAKVDTSYERIKNQNGSNSDAYSNAVTSNVPGMFKIKLTLFKGRPAEELEVEIYASINGRSCLLTLFSPGAIQALEDIRDMVIDEEIAKIRELTPDMVIIEQ